MGARLVKNELGSILKEAVETYLIHNPDICLEGLRKDPKIPVRIASVLTGIRTESLPNTTLERYRYARCFGVVGR